MKISQQAERVALRAYAHDAHVTGMFESAETTLLKDGTEITIYRPGDLAVMAMQHGDYGSRSASRGIGLRLPGKLQLINKLHLLILKAAFTSDLDPIGLLFKS